MTDETQEMNFEQAFSALQVTVQRLESGELTLEDSVALYELGRRLSVRCQALLDAAELRVKQVGD
jgi:exodeoxyribonuclease VII small subunit